MIYWSLSLLLFGLMMSAFFSGCETGFYRIPRVRLLIDALGGDWRARVLLWLTNHPSLFVATTLIGNNVANYFTSLAIVFAVDLALRDSTTVQILAPVVFAPLLFVFGELFPKSLFYHKPIRLLRFCGPLFIGFTVLAIPVSAMLWVASKIMEKLIGESPQRLQRRLARAELNRVLDEGQEAGILRSGQRRLAQGIFAVANRPIGQSALPATHWTWTYEGIARSAALELASRYQQDILPVEARDKPGSLAGYIRVPELYLDETSTKVTIHPWLDISSESTQLAALMEMQSAQEVLARLTDSAGETVGFITAEQLTDSFFHSVH